MVDFERDCLWAPPQAQSRAARHGCGAPPRTSPMSRRRASPLAPRLAPLADTALDLGEIFSADVPAAPLIYTQYVSTSNQYKVSTSQGGGLQIHASISNVVALFVRQEHYRPLDLCCRVLLGLLDLRVVLAQDRRVLPRGNGDATIFTWTV